MQWWNDFMDWFNSDEGWRVISGAVIPFVAIIVAGIIGGLIGRNSTRRLLSWQDRELQSAAVAAIIGVGDRASLWSTLPAGEKDHLDAQMSAADIRLRLLPITGSSAAADWASHELALMQRNSANFSFQAEQSFIDYRDRLLEWQRRPGRARKLFAADLERFRFESNEAETELVDQQRKWAADQLAEATREAPTDSAAAPVALAAGAVAVEAPAEPTVVEPTVVEPVTVVQPASAAEPEIVETAIIEPVAPEAGSAETGSVEPGPSETGSVETTAVETSSESTYVPASFPEPVSTAETSRGEEPTPAPLHEEVVAPDPVEPATAPQASYADETPARVEPVELAGTSYPQAEQASELPQPAGFDPAYAEPVYTEPVYAEPAAEQPDATEPDATEPGKQPIEPDEPVDSPLTKAPYVYEPFVAQPFGTGSAAAEPEAASADEEAPAAVESEPEGKPAETPPALIMPAEPTRNGDAASAVPVAPPVTFGRRVTRPAGSGAAPAPMDPNETQPYTGPYPGRDDIS